MPNAIIGTTRMLLVDNNSPPMIAEIISFLEEKESKLFRDTNHMRNIIVLKIMVLRHKTSQ
jgi:hypothetical protein